MPKTLSVPLTTSLSPVAHGVLGALAAREDPASCAGNVVLTRLLREEIERLAPGLWDGLVHQAVHQPTVSGKELGPREVSQAVAEQVGSALRARRG